MSRKIFRSFFVLILVIGSLAIQTTQSAHAAGPWYVATTGDDNNDCLSPSTPCATINGAIGKATSGDTINVAIGTYAGMGDQVVLIDRDITLSGGWDASFTSQNGTTTIDGGTVRIGIFVDSATTTVENFSIENGFFCSGGGILNHGSLTLLNSVVTNNKADNPCGAGGGGIWSFGTLTVRDTMISNNVGIQGGGIYVSGGSVDLSNVILANNTSNREGGAIYIYSFGTPPTTVSINRTTLSNNIANFDGGGIYAYQASLIIESSSITGNTTQTASTNGGGIFGYETNLTVTNSTISTNTTDYKGGGIYVTSANSATTNINSSTIAFNTAGVGGGTVHDGNSSIFTIRNSILAQNTGLIDGPDCSLGPLSSGGYNILGNTTGCSFNAAASDLTNTDPLLGQLIGPSGTPGYHPLLSGSPAIDAGDPAGCTDQDGNLLTIDQRGVTRPQATRCDIGAFELEAVSQAIQVTVDIRPGSRVNTINLKHDRLIPVAILSTPDFDAPKIVDRNSPTFGKTGDENSLAFCLKHGIKVNRDRLPDLVCYFRTSKTGFEFGDTEGILKGTTAENISLEGRDSVKILKIPKR